MRTLIASAAAIALATLVFADDKIGKTPAPTILAKSTQDLRKLPGYHFKYSGSVGEYSLETTGTVWNNGLVKQVPTTGSEIWRKDKAAFAKDKNGRYVGAASQGQQEQAIANSPTPDALLNEALAVGKLAKFAQDEEVDGKECKVIEAHAPEAKLREYMETMAKYWRPEMAAMAKRIQINDKESYMIYRVFVSKDDLVIRKIVRETKVVLADSVLRSMPEAAAVNGQLDQVLTVDLMKHGEELDEEIPAEIKKLLQVK